MTDIKITVLMPCYNAGKYIAEAIDSVLAQTFRDFELLIINDGASDNTADIIRSFSDERIVLIEQEQQGIAAALNNGLLHARADYIARFDADDICLSDRLEKQYRFMLEHPGCIVVGSAADYIDHNGQYVFTHLPAAKTNAEIQALSLHSCPFIHASVMYKKDVITGIGYNMHAHSFEDHLLWQQLKTKGEMYNMPEQLLRVRLNPGSITIDERKRPPAFHRIKANALQSGTISSQEGDKLRQLINGQNNMAVKQGAYYSLLAKKFLWNNYNPVRARQHMKTAIALNNFDINDYLLLCASYLPKKIIVNLYSLFTNR
jgi:glycosyltransferase involved in cell wall biosynthesis